MRKERTGKTLQMNLAQIDPQVANKKQIGVGVGVGVRLPYRHADADADADANCRRRR